MRKLYDPQNDKKGDEALRKQVKKMRRLKNPDYAECKNIGLYKKNFQTGEKEEIMPMCESFGQMLLIVENFRVRKNGRPESWCVNCVRNAAKVSKFKKRQRMNEIILKAEREGLPLPEFPEAGNKAKYDRQLQEMIGPARKKRSPWTEEQRARQSDRMKKIMKGKGHSLGHKTNLGKTFSADHRARIANAQRSRWLNKKAAEEKARLAKEKSRKHRKQKVYKKFTKAVLK